MEKRFIYFLFVFSFFMYGMIQFASADIGISIPYLKDNTYKMEDTDSQVFTFIIKNSGSAQETVKTRFYVPEEAPVELNGEKMFEQTYTLGPYETKNVEVEIQPDRETQFNLVYGFLEGSDNSGSLNFDVWVEGVFYVEVGDCNSNCNLYKLKLPYKDFSYLTIELDNVVDDYIVDGLVLRTNNGYIEFKRDVDLREFKEEYVIITKNRVYVDSGEFDELDVKAEVQMRNLPYDDMPIILKNGKECKDCSHEYYYNGVLTFDVTGFSEYTTEEDSEGISVVVNSEEDNSNSGSSSNIALNPNPTPTENVNMNTLDSSETAFTNIDTTPVDDSILDKFKRVTSGSDISDVRRNFPYALTIIFVTIIVILTIVTVRFSDEDVNELKDLFKRDKK